MPHSSVVVASEIWPSLSAHSRLLQREKSRTRCSAPSIGISGAPVRGMYRLKAVAARYSSTMTQIAASGPVSMAVSSSGRSRPSSQGEMRGPISWPPSRMPSTMEPTVRPSIQPLPLTSSDGGSSSVRMPYLAGE